MEHIVALLKEPVFDILLIVAIVCITLLVLKGRVTSLTKDGVVFSKAGGNKLDSIAAESREMIDTLAEIKAMLDSISTRQTNLEIKVGKLQCDVIKTQILINETPFDRKLELYDEYKKLGGNSWMDLFIAALKRKHCPDSMNRGRRSTDRGEDEPS